MQIDICLNLPVQLESIEIIIIKYTLERNAFRYLKFYSYAFISIYNVLFLDRLNTLN